MSSDTTPNTLDTHRHLREPLPDGSPTRVGRYEVLRVLGTGTFGRVYLGFDPDIERYVAVKTPILPPESHRAFLKEARIIADLHHEGICPVYDVGTQDGLPFIVMRYVGGGTLAELVRGGPVPAARALGFAAQLADGLEAAHGKGVVHRDLKPANVLYDADADTVLLTDFGIAKALESAAGSSGEVKGTPLYMAPEQWAPGGPFGDVSARTDVYSLGVILYQLLAGRVPFEGKPFQLMYAHCNTAPPPPSQVSPGLDPRLDAVCLTALAKRAEDRFPSARALADAVAAYLRPPAPEPAGPRAPRPGDEVGLPLPGGLAMTFCWVPPGRCQLGSPRAEPGRFGDEDEDRRGAFRTAGFWLAKYPVTQAEWKAVAGTDPSHFRPGGAGAAEVRGLDTARFPVECVSWNDICEPTGFLAKLAALGGADAAFGPGAHFALPHEDEWEYAARGGLGNGSPFYWGAELNGTQANCGGRSPYGTSQKGPYLRRPAPVGNYAAAYPHPWGLCDLHGNVWEWCENGYGGSVMKALRGGSWMNVPEYCRAAARGRNAANTRLNFCGLRVCVRPG